MTDQIPREIHPVDSGREVKRILLTPGEIIKKYSVDTERYYQTKLHPVDNGKDFQRKVYPANTERDYKTETLPIYTKQKCMQ